MSHALLASIDAMRACASGLRRISMCSMPGSTMSSTYRPLPRMNRLSSTLFRLAPSPPILISSRACVVTMMLPSGSAGGLRPDLLGGPQHGLDDVLVAGAAAEVARQGPADLVL